MDASSPSLGDRSDNASTASVAEIVDTLISVPRGILVPVGVNSEKQFEVTLQPTEAPFVLRPTRSPRAKNRTGGIRAFPAARNYNDEIAQMQARVDEAKAKLDSELYLLRTQITRIEELEKLLEVSVSQFAYSRRRREGELLELEAQRKQLAQQLERQLSENRVAEAELAARQEKSSAMCKVIEGQVVSLAETFTPAWTSKEMRALVRETAVAQRAMDSSSPFLFHQQTSADLFSQELSAEEESAAIQAVFDLRPREERLDEVERWMRQRELDARAHEEELRRSREEAEQQRLEDEKAAALHDRLQRLYPLYFPGETEATSSRATVDTAVALDACVEPVTADTPRPPSFHPKVRLMTRYATSAQRSINGHTFHRR